MQEDFVDTDGLTRAEKSEELTNWMERVLNDNNYTELHRQIFQIYSQNIARNQKELDSLKEQIQETETQIASEHNRVLRAEA